MRLLFVIPCGRFAPSGVVRVQRYFPYLRRRGVHWTLRNHSSPVQVALMRRLYRDGAPRPRAVRVPLRWAARAVEILHRRVVDASLVATAGRYDAVFLQWAVPSAAVLERLIARAKRIIFDFDDAVFLERPAETQRLVRCAWRVVVGSQYLFEYARALNPATTLIPSSVDVERFLVPNQEQDLPPDRPVRLGWIGGPSTLRYLPVLGEALRVLAARGLRPELFLAGVAGRRDLLPDFGPVSVAIVDEYRDADVPSLVSRIDIGTMPLADGPWERGKCAMKALTYMAGGKPCVASRVGENVRVIEDGSNGFLASGAVEWAAKLEILLHRPDVRASMGSLGRKTVEERYSTSVCFELLWSRILADLRKGTDPI